MKFRIIASALLLLILLGLYGLFKKDAVDSESAAPAPVSQTDDNSFKGLGK